MEAKELSELRARERLSEVQEVMKVIAHTMAIPLFLLFWICDLIYVPERKWEFLLLRLSIIPFCLFVNHISKRLKTYEQAQVLALSYIFGLSLPINIMIWIIGTTATPYYAGLNLVAVGCLSFIPWSKLYYAHTVGVIYGPFVLISALTINSMEDARALLVSSFFIVGTIVISFFIRFFNEELRQKELKSRIALQDEVLNRERIIQDKTIEAVQLQSLSSQFSPQVVAAIQNGSIDLKAKVHRSEICAIFIDIVNSTERVNRIDKDKFDRVISKFMEDSVKIMLKYDITIDKFLGDGILGFCNDPVKHTDHAERVVDAALEIIHKIKTNQDFYEPNWKNEFQVKVGIASGFANVGFYGSDRYFRSYTAIGPVVNLASRLCSIAQPNQIVIEFDVFEKIGAENYKTAFLGKKTLKGFEEDQIRAYEVISKADEETIPLGVFECPACNRVLSLDTDENGIFVFKCRTCDYVMTEGNPQKGAA